MAGAGSTAEQPAGPQSSRGRGDEATSWCRVHLKQPVSTDGKEQPTVSLCAQTEVKGQKTLQLGADSRSSTAVRSPPTSGRMTLKSLGGESVTGLGFRINKHPSLFEGMTSLVRQRVCQQNTGQTCLPSGQLEKAKKRLLLRMRRRFTAAQKGSVSHREHLCHISLRVGPGRASDLTRPCLY